ncbi:RING finger protein 113-like protein [Senna tora]|uniref:RING finger protein 113-like protein n=1 Tax=Senna tora TaxID=362788 RepID=A0A834WIB7_9FABA|nr:RING finger protein 113-like protein [Senna tora]
MSSESPASKHRYDITKSRRTRKQLGRSEQGDHHHQAKKKENTNGNINAVSLEDLLDNDDDEMNDQHKSLKQLINGDQHHHHHLQYDNNKGRNSLGQHFNEEERNNNQHESVQQGLKFKKLVRRYAKLLGQHLIKPKPHDSPNKPLFKLSK